MVAFVLDSQRPIATNFLRLVQSSKINLSKSLTQPMCKCTFVHMKDLTTQYTVLGYRRLEKLFPTPEEISAPSVTEKVIGRSLATRRAVAMKYADPTLYQVIVVDWTGHEQLRLGG